MSTRMALSDLIRLAAEAPAVSKPVPRAAAARQVQDAARGTGLLTASEIDRRFWLMRTEQQRRAWRMNMCVRYHLPV